MDRVSAAEKYIHDYRELLCTMPKKEICEEVSYLLAVKEAVKDKYNDYQSIVSYMIDEMFQYCHDEVLARVIEGSLEPIPENLV